MATDEAVREYSPAIRDLGDKIVQLTLKDAMELKRYLEEEHGIVADRACGIREAVENFR